MSYDSFVTDSSFTLLRPIFITFIVFLIITFFLIIYPSTRRKIVNGFGVIGLSIVSSVISVQLIYYHAIIADEINLGGDGVITIMCLVIITLSLLNPILFFNHTKKNTVKEKQH